jgi:hypothetical protein
MKDTFSKLHHNFESIHSSKESRRYEEEPEDDERKRRKEIGLKMLMSRESSFGAVGFRSVDRSSKIMKSLMDDTSVNQHL